MSGLPWEGGSLRRGLAWSSVTEPPKGQGRWKEGQPFRRESWKEGLCIPEGYSRRASRELRTRSKAFNTVLVTLNFKDLASTSLQLTVKGPRVGLASLELGTRTEQPRLGLEKPDPRPDGGQMVTCKSQKRKRRCSRGACREVKRHQAPYDPLGQP